MKAFLITIPVCLVAMIIVFAITNHSVVHTQPVDYTKQTEANKPISQELITQSDSNITTHLNDSIGKDTSPVDTLNTANKVAESDKNLSSDSSSSSLPSLSDQKPKSEDSKIKNKTAVRKIAVNASGKKHDVIEFGDISPANTPASGIADKNADSRLKTSDGALVHKN